MRAKLINAKIVEASFNMVKWFLLFAILMMLKYIYMMKYKKGDNNAILSVS